MAGTYDKQIWDYLKLYYTNDYLVAGLMGNLFAESGLRPNNLENSKESEIGYNDSTYTQAIDNGTYTNFVDDACGYGLAQWTFYSRKQALYNLKLSRGVSIGDINLQLEYLMMELQTTFYDLFTLLNQESDSVRMASDAILVEFENPADQSEKVQLQRAKYGQVYYDRYSSGTDKTKSKFKLLLYEG